MNNLLTFLAGGSASFILPFFPFFSFSLFTMELRRMVQNYNESVQY